MARSNKYTSLNLNGIFEKKLNNNNNQSASNNAKSLPNQGKTVLSNSRIHGHMLVLTRPAPKPISIPHKPDNGLKDSSSTSSPDLSKPISAPESISLRPQGRTGSGPSLTPLPLSSPLSSPSKSGRFVPPHRRPGFAGKEENPQSQLVRGGSGSFKGKPEVRGNRPIQDQGLNTVDGRPKSGGGYELADLNRPRSSGIRPSSSG